jgi:hypothetical protein
MRHLLSIAVVLAVCMGAGACHPGPVIGGDPRAVGGTISGIVTADESTPLSGRRVTITEINTNQRYETTTASDGGYTIQVPQGTYRIELELRPGESLARRPENTRVDRSDLDSGRNFVVTVSTPGR